MSNEQYFQIDVLEDKQVVESHLLICENESSDELQAIVRDYARLDTNSNSDILPLREFVEKCQCRDYWCRLESLLPELGYWWAYIEMGDSVEVTHREVTIG